MSVQGQGLFRMTKCSKVRLQVSVLRSNGSLMTRVRNRRDAPQTSHGHPTISLRSPAVTQKVDESQSKKSYNARMNCKHIRRSQRSPTMSKLNRRENRSTVIGVFAVILCYVMLCYITTDKRVYGGDTTRM